jgi:predicted permease
MIPLAGLEIPAPAEHFLKLIGDAASPCALVALGTFLAAKRGRAKEHVGSVALLVGFKLFLQPAVTWIMATAVFSLSPALTHTTVLLAALPTGTGPFMLAEFYRREASMTSHVILASTVVSLVTVCGYLAIAT